MSIMGPGAVASCGICGSTWLWRLQQTRSLGQSWDPHFHLASFIPDHFTSLGSRPLHQIFQSIPLLLESARDSSFHLLSSENLNSYLCIFSTNHLIIDHSFYINAMRCAKGCMNIYIYVYIYMYERIYKNI